MSAEFSGRPPARGRRAHAREPKASARLAVVLLLATAVFAVVGLVVRGLADSPATRQTERAAALAGNGAETGAGSGAETGAGSGAETGAGSGAETGAGRGAETGPSDGGRAIQTGPGTFSYADSAGPAHGRGGTLRRFQVAVEQGSGQDAAAFAAAIDAVLADQRGWIAGGDVRFQRVAGATAAEFSVVLATAGTSQAICAAGGVHTRGFASCHLPGKIVINLDRWSAGVPEYGASIEEYRAFAVNHEIGHELGFGHEACPLAGKRAPVMQQQSLGLRGCTANGWPYLQGRRYAGAPVP